MTVVLAGTFSAGTVVTAELPAPDALELKVGTTMAVTVDGGLADIVERGEATLLPFEEAATRRLWASPRGYHAGSVGASPGKGEIPAAPPVVAGRVSFKLAEFPQGQTLLAVENGTDSAFAYHAILVRDGRDRSTTVCPVREGKRTIEHWPYPVAAVRIVGGHSITLTPGVPLKCE